MLGIEDAQRTDVLHATSHHSRDISVGCDTHPAALNLSSHRIVSCVH
jgi:hypothetical protein